MNAVENVERYFVADAATFNSTLGTVVVKNSFVASEITTELAHQPCEATAALHALETLREFWQTTAPFDPVRALDSWETRYERGKTL